MDNPETNATLGTRHVLVDNNGCSFLDIIGFIVKFPSCTIDFQRNISWSFYASLLEVNGDCSLC